MLGAAVALAVRAASVDANPVPAVDKP